MPLKLIHVADAHLGAKFLWLGRKGAEQRSRQLAAFESAVDLALQERADLMIVAGDLFDSQQVSRSVVARVVAAFERLGAAGIHTCLTPGTHDPWEPASPYAAPPLADLEHLTVFRTESMTPKRFPELDCVVYGNANTTPFGNKFPLEGFVAGDDSRWRIGVCHANFEIPDVVEDTYIVSPAQIAACGLDYLALGHLHSLSDRTSGGVTSYYAGSPELLRPQKGDCGHALVVELDGGAAVRHERVGKTTFEEINIEVESLDDYAGAVSSIEKSAEPDKVLKVTIEGLRRTGLVEVDALAEELSEHFFAVLVNDRSMTAPATVEPSNYPAGSPAAVFLETMRGRLSEASVSEEQEIMEAMQVGASLLGGD